MRLIESAIIAAGFAVLLASCSVGTPSKVTQATGLFASEADARIDGSLNHPAPKRLASLQVNANVTVLWDTYGKDYWACYVRTESAGVGWVLCSSLNYHGSSGA